MTSDLQLEYQIIGTFVMDESTHDYISKLKDDDFQDGICKKLFKAMQTMKSKNHEITLFALSDTTKIPISTIGKITATVATTATIESDCKLLKDKSNRRKLIQKANKIIKMASDTTKEVQEIKNNALQEIYELEDIIDEEVITLREGMIETTALLEFQYLIGSL